MSTTWFVDEVGGNDSNSGLTFALRKKTLAGVATAGAAAGDTIRVMGKVPSTSGINATFTNLSSAVTLASALTQSLYTSGAAWSPKTNVTATGSQSGKLSATSASNIAIAAAFTTGVAAFFATGTLNLSGYQQLSFWVKPNAAVASGVLRLDLCSDNAGATPVNQLILPALTSGQWNLVTIDLGANFGASILSIRLFAISDPGTVTLTFDDIIACKAASNAGCLTLNSLISSDGATWYGIKSINGTAVVLDTGGTSSAQTALGVWSGTTGSAALSILAPLTKSASGTGGAAITDTFNNAASGTAGSPITISGGWDSTAMTTQSGLTAFDGVSATATVGLTVGCDFVTLDHLVFARFNTPINLNGSTKKGYTLSNFTITDCAGLFTLPSRAVTFSTCNILNSAGGISIPQSTNYNTDGAAYSLAFVKMIGNTSGDGIVVPANVGSPAISIHDCTVKGSTTGNTNGFNIQSPCIFYNNTSNDNASGSTAVGFLFQNANGIVAGNLQGRNNSGAQVQINNATVEIYGLDTNFNLGTQVKFVSGSEGQAVIYDWVQNGTATKYSLGNPATGETSGNAIFAHREGAVVANNSIYNDYGVVTTTGVVGQPGTGVGWKLSPNANAFASSPLRLNVGKVPCPAGVATTVKFYAKCSAASGIGAQLRVVGGRYPGVGSPGTDVTAAVSGTAWTQYSLTFTPTENCVVDVFFEAWGSSSQTATISGPVTITQ
ncbi:MAG: hypothetical protein JSS83_26630 [Cyanobacteria bacterium SZAS LIN-3]|nr:hypothetical protein [Cyanobacteria bacterium SZAS LIN-3]